MSYHSKYRGSTIDSAVEQMLLNSKPYIKIASRETATLNFQDGDMEIPAHKPLKITNKLSNTTFKGKPITWADLSHADISHLTNLNAFFSYCKINEVNVEFDTSSITSMYNMFMGCYALEHIYGIGQWDTSKVTNMNYMFADCYQLHTLNIGNWDTSNVTSMLGTFAGCQARILDLSGWDCSKVIKCRDMFYQDVTPKIHLIRFGEGFGKMPGTQTVDLSKQTAWVSEVSSLTKLYDRKSNGMGIMTFKLSANSYAKLSQEQLTTITNKGYNIISA